jgi:flagellin-specific chaperone FliS
VRDTLSRAAGTLGRIDYRNLSQPARLQYDMAKHFMEQADEALKAKNYTAAQLMAEKAETIAKELSGR